MSNGVIEWLEQLGLGQYVQVFAENDVDFRSLPKLTEQDLKDLGVSLGHRRVLQDAISTLGKQSAATAAAPESADASASRPQARQAERRQLSVMFCDLVGSTPLSQRLDPEDLRDVIRAYQDCCKLAIDRYEGFVSRYMGDGVLAYFGYPQAHEDDAERAVRAGLGVMEAMVELNAGVGRERDVKLAVRIGIATGQVVAGDLIGDGASEESAVLGETPNLAARLQSVAHANNVVIASRTRELVGERFECEDLGEHELKGFSESMRVWRVIGEGQAESRFEARRSRRLTPLLGREHELELLRERWEQAKGGEGQVVLLSGEAGIGKSRIAQALHDRIGDDKRVRLHYQCSPYHTNSALYPFITQLERAAGFKAGDTADARLEKFERLLKRSSQERERHIPLLAALLSVPTGERYPALALSSQRQKDETLKALVTQLRGLSGVQPVFVVFEDVHWADPTSLELLELMVAEVQGLAGLVLITFRSEFRPPWSAYTHVTSLTLNPFSQKLATAMVKQVAGGESLPSEVVKQIVARTDGIPLFIEELTRSVLESHRLQAGGKRDDASRATASVMIPATLHDSLMARLDRVPAVKEVAQCASVIGREFPYKLLAAVSALGDSALASALDQLIDAELLFKRGALPHEAVYSFKHALVQDAAYDSLLRRKRQRLHGRIAEALQAQFLEITTVQPEQLAHHYTEAGQALKAIDYWLQAGRRAAERSANKEAVVHLSKGLAVLATLPPSTQRTRHELTFQMALCGPLMATKGWCSEETAKTYARARELCELLGETEQFLPVLHGQWVQLLVGAEYRAAREVADRLLRLGEQQRDTAAILQGHRLLAWTAFFLGELPAVGRHLNQALSLYDRKQHSSLRFRYLHDPRVAALTFRVYEQWLCGFPDQALETGAESIAYAREFNHASSLAYALWLGGAQPAVLCGDTRAAEEFANELLVLSQEQGFPMFLAVGRMIAGWAIGTRGRREEGMSLLREGLHHYTAGGQKASWPFYLSWLVELCIDGGELEEASQALDKANLLVEVTEERWWEPEIHRLTGELFLAQGSDGSEQAETRFGQAIAIARDQGAKSLELRTTVSLARLRQNQGKHEEARELLAPVYEWFTEGFDTADLKDAKALLESLS